MAVIAFVPVRCGSKSIPLKNIKPLLGKPLVYWVLRALDRTRGVDRVVVATDSDLIESVVCGFEFAKVSVYRRLAENAIDSASTESVMLEWLNSASSTAQEEDLFVLVQATSPLLQSTHLSEALQQYANGHCDSIVTCVQQRRFFWNADGTPHNYDYLNRPRRQEFAGSLMENGAFYISTVSCIRQSKCRISGRIGIYTMPEYTAVELDEADDWIIVEQLLRRHVEPAIMPEKNVKLFVSDVDGVLTDGGMYYSENGDEVKKFNTRDGMGFQLLREHGIKTAFVTSEVTHLVDRRAAKLKIDYVCQGSTKVGKLDAIRRMCEKEGLSLSETAYIGDDINCYEALSHVGFPACPADAVRAVKQITNIRILLSNGGQGAVREFVDHIIGLNDLCAQRSSHS
jgi:YrbI family 3-deoxy-D-manno-octulosonate 8-phosphate phosphatase